MVYDGVVTTHSPTHVGFHCSGSCWEERGGPEGLLAYLTEQGLAKRDWFVRAEWTLKPAALVPLPAASSIHPIQDYLELDAVAAYRDTSLTLAERQYWEMHPTLFTWESKTYVFQGTHRLAAALLNGETSYRGWHVDLSAL